MTLQNYEQKSAAIKDRFIDAKRKDPKRFEARLAMSWSNWGFGREELSRSLERLAGEGLKYVELHGNHYGPDLGYKTGPTAALLKQYGLELSGVCGMFSDDNDLSSNRGIERQEAIYYIQRELDFTAELGGHYLLVVPGSVGRPDPYDSAEFDRSVETLQIVAPAFAKAKVRAAIEPIRSAEVSLVRTVADAKRYIAAVDREWVDRINGDVYHMQSEEPHIPSAILEAGDQLVNLHLADSNRCALGEGSMDVDTMIMALYLIGHNSPGRFVTPEPLGPGGAPYPAMNGYPDPAALDKLVHTTVTTWREREDVVRAL